jgi:hypothetical protein
MRNSWETEILKMNQTEMLEIVSLISNIKNLSWKCQEQTRSIGKK